MDFLGHVLASLIVGLILVWLTLWVGAAGIAGIALVVKGWLLIPFGKRGLPCYGGCGTRLEHRTYCDPCAAVYTAKDTAKRARKQKSYDRAHAQWMAAQRQARRKLAKITPKRGPVTVPKGQPYRP
jgi:UDP:flavonoid glycosyltransferase YjiC (YdhE family)